jgi:hypothetical protein
MSTTFEQLDNTGAAPAAHARRGRARRVLKIAGIALTGLFMLSEASSFVWKSSGSNAWKLVSDQNGIRIWTLKTPGSSLLKVKGEMRTNARLSSIVAILEETEVMDKSVGIAKTTVLEKKETPSLYMMYVHYVHDLSVPTGLPIAPREFILQMHHSQDPVTKAVQINVLAAPNKLPPNKAFVRITHLNNIWTVRPLPNGEVDLQAEADVDLGGNLPDFFKNLMMPEVIKGLCTSVRKLSGQDRYVNAKVAYIREPDQQG